MKDIQNQADNRRINIKKVGVKTVTYPITVLDKAQKSQKTVATINMYVNLPHRFKGTHMSRFIEILNRHHGKIDIRGFTSVLEEMKRRLNAEAAHVEMIFPYFLHRNDGTDTLRLVEYDCAMNCFLEDDDDLRLDVSVPIMPPLDTHETGGASGGLGLWGKVLVSVRFRRFMWIEDIIDIVESIIIRETTGKRSAAFLEKPIETLLEQLERRFDGLAELKWYAITVENLSQGYSLYARTASSQETEEISDQHSNH